MTDTPEPARLTATPPGVTLCRLDDIADNTARNVVLQMRAGRFHGFVVRKGDTVHGYVDRCPHMGLPLAHKLDDYLTPDGRHISCDWHGALFDPLDGNCVAGPCPGQHLFRWPVHVAAGAVLTGAYPASAASSTLP